MMVLGSLAYHDYNIAAGRLEERETLGKDCAKGDAVILRNHGTLALGCSIPNAFERMYYLETACQIQVETMSCGQELVMIDQEVLQRGMARAEARFAEPTSGQRLWESMLRQLDRDGTDDYRR
jgi:ribulose-5-phosphate 4-epimerase/fuculose-1-phosphate aldolase